MSDNLSMFSKRTFIILGGIVLLVALYLYLLPKVSESPDKVALEVLGCIESKNVACILKRIPENEINAHKLTEEKLKRFLEEYFAPAYAGKIVTFEDYTSRESKSASYSKEFEAPSGHIVGYGVYAKKKSDSTVMCPGLLDGLVTNAMQCRFSNDQKLATKLGLMERLLKIAQKDRRILESMGINGVYRGRTLGFQTWDQYIRSCEESIKKYGPGT